MVPHSVAWTVAVLVDWKAWPLAASMAVQWVALMVETSAVCWAGPLAGSRAVSKAANSVAQ